MSTKHKLVDNSVNNRRVGRHSRTNTSLYRHVLCNNHSRQQHNLNMSFTPSGSVSQMTPTLIQRLSIETIVKAVHAISHFVRPQHLSDQLEDHLLSLMGNPEVVVPFVPPIPMGEVMATREWLTTHSLAALSAAGISGETVDAMNRYIADTHLDLPAVDSVVDSVAQPLGVDVEAVEAVPTVSSSIISASTPSSRSATVSPLLSRHVTSLSPQLGSDGCGGSGRSSDTTTESDPSSED